MGLAHICPITTSQFTRQEPVTVVHLHDSKLSSVPQVVASRGTLPWVSRPRICLRGPAPCVICGTTAVVPIHQAAPIAVLAHDHGAPLTKIAGAKGETDDTVDTHDHGPGHGIGTAVAGTTGNTIGTGTTEIERETETATGTETGIERGTEIEKG